MSRESTPEPCYFCRANGPPPGGQVRLELAASIISRSPAESPESPLRPIGGELLQASARSLRVRVVHLPAWVLVSGPGRRRVVIVGSSKGLVAQEPVCFVEPRRNSSAAVSLGLRSGWTRLASRESRRIWQWASNADGIWCVVSAKRPAAARSGNLGHRQILPAGRMRSTR